MLLDFGVFTNPFGFTKFDYIGFVYLGTLNLYIYIYVDFNFNLKIYILEGVDHEPKKGVLRVTLKTTVGLDNHFLGTLQYSRFWSMKKKIEWIRFITKKLYCIYCGIFWGVGVLFHCLVDSLRVSCEVMYRCSQTHKSI